MKLKGRRQSKNVEDATEGKGTPRFSIGRGNESFKPDSYEALTKGHLTDKTPMSRQQDLETDLLNLDAQRYGIGDRSRKLRQLQDTAKPTKLKKAKFLNPKPYKITELTTNSYSD